MITIKSLIVPLIFIRLTVATLTYCSSENTGSSLVNSSIWQSNGLCHDKCLGDGYALAIVQYQDCWCSNYAPADTVDLDECDQTCPGYPSEMCGGDGLYGYIYLADPSGTVGSSSSTTSSSTRASTSPSTTSTSPSTSSTSPSTTSTTSSSTSPSSSIDADTTSSETSSSTESSTTPTTTSQSSSTTSTTSSSTYSPTTTSTTSSSSSDPTTTSESSSSSVIPATTTTRPSTTTTRSSSTRAASTPVITSIIYSVSTVTGGQETQYITTGIQTTITNSETPSSSINSDSIARATGVDTTDRSAKTGDSFFDHKGKVAGVFTVVGVVGLALLLLLIWLLVRCLRKNRDYDDEDVVGVEGFKHERVGKNNNYPIVTKTNILHDDDFNEASSTDDTVINEKQHSNANSMKQKSNGANGNGNNGHRRNVSIVSTDFGTPIIDNHGDSTYVDQRLDVGTFSNIHERDEVLSLNDNEDYSRKVLRVTNP